MSTAALITIEALKTAGEQAMNTYRQLVYRIVAGEQVHRGQVLPILVDAGLSVAELEADVAFLEARKEAEQTVAGMKDRQAELTRFHEETSAAEAELTRLRAELEPRIAAARAKATAAREKACAFSKEIMRLASSAAGTLNRYNSRLQIGGAAEQPSHLRNIDGLREAVAEGRTEIAGLEERLCAARKKLRPDPWEESGENVSSMVTAEREQKKRERQANFDAIEQQLANQKQQLAEAEMQLVREIQAYHRAEGRTPKDEQELLAGVRRQRPNNWRETVDDPVDQPKESKADGE